MADKRVYKKKINGKNATGRKTIKLDLDMIDKLCQIQCTGDEIAGMFDIDYDTLNAGLKRETGLCFSDYFKIKSSKGKASLRKSQFEMAKTNPTMSKHLGIQYLGQTDKQEIQHSGEIRQVQIVDDIK